MTVNDVEKQTFGINLVPHTKTVTTWGDMQVGDAINLEIDTLADMLRVCRLSGLGVHKPFDQLF